MWQLSKYWEIRCHNKFQESPKLLPSVHKQTNFEHALVSFSSMSPIMNNYFRIGVKQKLGKCQHCVSLMREFACNWALLSEQPFRENQNNKESELKRIMRWSRSTQRRGNRRPGPWLDFGQLLFRDAHDLDVRTLSWGPIVSRIKPLALRHGR